MAKSPLHKLQETVVGTVKEALTHPVGTAEKAVEQTKGALSLGRLVAEQVTKSAAGVIVSRLPGHGGSAPAPERPLRAVTPEEPAAGTAAKPTAQSPAPAPATAKTAPKTAAKTATTRKPTRPPVTDVATEMVKEQAAHQPVKKAPPAPESPIDAAADPSRVEATPVDVARKAAKKAPAKKAAAKKAPAKKTAAKKAPAKKAGTSTPSAKLPASKAPAKKAARSAAEVLEDTSVETPVGTTGADVAHNPDTTDTDLQQPGTAPLMDPATTKAVASEQATLSAAADTEKG